MMVTGKVERKTNTEMNEMNIQVAANISRGRYFKVGRELVADAGTER